jgi:Flp pilus assembly protein TadD
MQLGQKEAARSAFQQALLLGPASSTVLDGIRRATH